MKTELRRRPDNVKDVKLIEHDFENLRLRSEDVANHMKTEKVNTKSELDTLALPRELP